MYLLQLFPQLCERVRSAALGDPVGAGLLFVEEQLDQRLDLGAAQWRHLHDRLHLLQTQTICRTHKHTITRLMTAGSACTGRFPPPGGSVTGLPSSRNIDYLHVGGATRTCYFR